MNPFPEQALFSGSVGIALGASSVDRVLLSGGFLEASRSRQTFQAGKGTCKVGAKSEEQGSTEPERFP